MTSKKMKRANQDLDWSIHIYIYIYILFSIFVITNFRPHRMKEKFLKYFSYSQNSQYSYTVHLKVKLAKQQEFYKFFQII